ETSHRRACPANVPPAANPDRLGTHFLVEHIHLRVGDWAADRRRSFTKGLHRLHPVTGRKGGALRRAVADHSSFAWSCTYRFTSPYGRNHVAPREELFDVVQASASRLHHLVEQRCGEVYRIEFRAFDKAAQFLRRDRPWRIEIEFSTMQQASPDLEGGRIERQGGDLQKSPAGTEGADAISHYQPDDVAMRHADALRQSRRT